MPGIGLLDDAVMIELVFRELRHEIEAYEDYGRLRRSLPKPLSSRREVLAAKLDRRRVAADGPHASPSRRGAAPPAPR